MKLVYVEWLDSCGPNGWTAISELDDRVSRIRSVGWVLHDTEEGLTILPHYEPSRHDGKPYQGKGIVSIPKECITRAVPMDEPGEK